MDEVRLSDWPEPPGSTAWLPAYGFQHDIIEKDDYFGTNGESRALFTSYLYTFQTNDIQ